MLVAMGLFFAVKLRKEKNIFPAFIFLGLTLGALSITKVQFFIPVALPILLLASLKLWEKRREPRYLALSTAGLVAPPLALMWLQRWISNGPASLLPRDVHVGLGENVVASAANAGLAPLAEYLWSATLAAFHEYFLSGTFVATYWQIYGWRDTPVTIVNGHFQDVLHAIIITITLLVFVLVALRVIRNALRVAKIFCHGRQSMALRLAAADPLFNSYLVFMFLMFVLFIVTDNVFQAAGRQWYPYVFAALACGVWYAPHASKRFATSASTAIASLLLLYVSVAAPYAIADIHQRFYGMPSGTYLSEVPRAAMVQGVSTGVFYPPYSAEYVVSDSSFPSNFHRGSRLRLTGAAVDTSRARSAKVAIVLDGRRPIPTLSGNVYAKSAVYGSAYANSGFSAVLDTSTLAEGPHVVTAYVATGGNRFAKVYPDRLFFVSSLGERFSSAFLQGLSKVRRAEGTVQASTCDGDALQQNAAVSRTRQVLLFGMADDPVTRKALPITWAMLDRRYAYPGRTRRDAKGDEAFQIAIGTRDLAPGHHKAVVYAMSSDSLHVFKVASGVDFIVGGRPPSQGFWWTSRSVRACDDPLHQFRGAEIE